MDIVTTLAPIADATERIMDVLPEPEGPVSIRGQPCCTQSMVDSTSRRCSVEVDLANDKSCILACHCCRGSRARPTCKVDSEVLLYRSAAGGVSGKKFANMSFMKARSVGERKRCVKSSSTQSLALPAWRNPFSDDSSDSQRKTSRRLNSQGPPLAPKRRRRTTSSDFDLREAALADEHQVIGPESVGIDNRETVDKRSRKTLATAALMVWVLSGTYTSPLWSKQALRPSSTDCEAKFISSSRTQSPFFIALRKGASRQAKVPVAAPSTGASDPNKSRRSVCSDRLIRVRGTPAAEAVALHCSQYTHSVVARCLRIERKGLRESSGASAIGYGERAYTQLTGTLDDLSRHRVDRASVRRDKAAQFSQTLLAFFVETLPSQCHQSGRIRSKSINAKASRIEIDEVAEVL
ncbi:midasin [Hortaea werneckii]|nr:midasin [Hortaea werneckii]